MIRSWCARLASNRDGMYVNVVTTRSAEVHASARVIHMTKDNDMADKECMCPIDKAVFAVTEVPGSHYERIIIEWKCTDCDTTTSADLYKDDFMEDEEIGPRLTFEDTGIKPYDGRHE